MDEHEIYLESAPVETKLPTDSETRVDCTRAPSVNVSVLSGDIVQSSANISPAEEKLITILNVIILPFVVRNAVSPLYVAVPE